MSLEKVSEARKKKLRDLVANIDRIREVLEIYQQQTFIRNFRKWEKGRKKTIKTLEDAWQKLEELAETNRTQKITLHKAKKVFGKGVLASSFVSYTFGSVLPYFSVPKDFCDSLINVGKLILGYGGAGLAVVTGIELLLKDNPFNEAKSILRWDKEQTENLFPFIQRSENLEKEFEDIFGCPITSITSKDFFFVIRQIQVICTRSDIILAEFIPLTFETVENISDAVYRIFKHINREDVIWENVIYIVSRLQNFNDNTKLLIRYFLKYEEVRNAILGIENYFGVFFQLATFKERMTSMLKDNTFRALLQFSSAIIYPSCPIIGISISMLDMVYKEEDVTENPSKYSKEINKVIPFLKEELEQMQNVYSEIIKIEG